MTKNLRRLTLVACLAALALADGAAAQDSPKGLFGSLTPSASAGEGVDIETHPPLRLTPDKSELVQLTDDAASIIIGNPAHANVLLDSSRQLVVVPRAPGATHFTVLNSSGQVVMQRHVIVASPKDNYIRLRRTCALASGDCANTSVYYCPDMCHEIALTEDAANVQEGDAQEDEARSDNQDETEGENP